MRVKEYLRRKVAFFASVIEIAISIIVLIAIVIAGIQVVREVFSLAGDPKAHEGFTVFLGHAFNLIIGVEFIKMLAKHTPGSAIEVLLFAIARQMVVEHTSPLHRRLQIRKKPLPWDAMSGAKAFLQKWDAERAYSLKAHRRCPR